MLSRRSLLALPLALCLPAAHATSGVFIAPAVVPEDQIAPFAVARSAPTSAPVQVHEPTADRERVAKQLFLSSGSVLVLDPNTREVLLTKGARSVRPIASITKLMTALLVVESWQPMDEMLTITAEDVDTIKNTHSRLWVGAQLSRGELLHLALMSSENRAAHALGRNTPGGLDMFVRRMNRRAAELGMANTHYSDPTGLSEENRSTAMDLARLVMETSKHQTIRSLSTDIETQVAMGDRTVTYKTSNKLVKNPTWDIELQKTGYIREAGRCLVMQASMSGRKVIMVLLDAATPALRMLDAQRVRHWLEGVSPADAVRMTRASVRPAKAFKARRGTLSAKKRAPKRR